VWPLLPAMRNGKTSRFGRAGSIRLANGPVRGRESISGRKEPADFSLGLNFIDVSAQIVGDGFDRPAALDQLLELVEMPRRISPQAGRHSRPLAGTSATADPGDRSVR
jgi:hypothetical protein